jgi:hypothetical protein
MDHDSEKTLDKKPYSTVLLPGNVLGDSFRLALTALSGEILL